jgi:hypothetical protein
MTRIERIDAEHFAFIRDDPPHPRHPRSMDTFFVTNIHSRTVPLKRKFSAPWRSLCGQ